MRRPPDLERGAMLASSLRAPQGGIGRSLWSGARVRLEGKTMRYPRTASSARLSFGLIGALCVLLAACGGSKPTATPQPTTSAASPTTAAASVTQPTRGASSASAVASTVAPTVAPSAATSAIGTSTTTAARGSATAQATTSGSPAASAVAGNPNVARQDFTVDFGDFQTRAQLTYPASSSGPFPTIVLIPGTGPYDMDFTILDRQTGAVRSRIFGDIAQYLTANGYAVVRYDKHYITGPTDQQNPSVTAKFYALSQKQLLADADKVYQSARTNPRVDPKRVFLYGWSEGTTHATALVLAHPEIAGLILQAPVAGSWKDTFAYQSLDVGVGFLRDVADTNKDGAITIEEILAAFRSSPGTASGDAAILTLDLSQPAASSASSAAATAPASSAAAPSASNGLRLNPQTDKNGDGKLDIAGEIVPSSQGFFANFDKNARNSTFSQYTSDKSLPTIVSSLPGYKGPVLILQGERDANVNPAGAKQIDDAIAASGNSGHALNTYPNLGHSLGQTPSVYADNFQPIDPKPLEDTLGWLGAHARK